LAHLPFILALGLVTVIIKGASRKLAGRCVRPHVVFSI